MCDHTNYGSGFKEETDKSYFQETSDLRGTVCQLYSVAFGDVAIKGVIVPSMKNRIYICAGRSKYSHCVQTVN